MSWAWMIGGPWLLPGLLAGGLVLLLAWVFACAVRLPAHSQRLGEWGQGAALLAIVFSFGPAWWTISLPRSGALDSSNPSGQVGSSIPRNQEPEVGVRIDLPVLTHPPILMETDDFSDLVELPVLSATEESHSTTRAEETRPQASPGMGESEIALSPADFPWTVSLPKLAGWIGFGHALTGLAILFYWLAGHLGLYRLLYHSSPVSPEVERAAREVAGEVRLPRLLQSSRVSAPLSCGLVRPTVVFPAALCETADPAALRWVLAHELTHLRRRDPWTCLLFGLGAVAFFPWPWFWWLRRRVRLCQEFIADGQAVSLGGSVEDYADFLLRLRAAPVWPGTALGGLGHSSDLYRRVTMLLKTGKVVTAQTSRWWSLGGAVILVALAVLLAGIDLRAEAAPAGEDDVFLLEQPNKEQPKKKEENKAQEKKEVWPNLEMEFLDLQKLFPEGLPADIQEKIKAEQARLQNILEQIRETAIGIRSQNLVKKQQEFARQERNRALKAYEEARKQFPQYAFQPNIPLQFFSPDGRLGVRIEKPSSTLVEQLDLPKDQGVVIEEVVPGSPAAKAGLKVNDILLQLGGKVVPNSPAEAVRLISKLQSDKPMEAVVLRKGKKETLKGLSLPGKKESVWDLRMIPQVPKVPVQPFIFSRPGGGVMTTVFRSADRFTARHQEGNLVLTVTGTVAGGKAQTKEITVQDGAVVNKYESVEKVPDQYRDKAKNLVEMAEKGAVRVEIHSE